MTKKVVEQKAPEPETDSFGNYRRLPYLPHKVAAVKVDGELELSGRLYEFHSWLASEMDYKSLNAYIEFVLQDYARLLLKDNTARLGSLVARAQLRGHHIDATDFPFEGQSPLAQLDDLE